MVETMIITRGKEGSRIVTSKGGQRVTYDIPPALATQRLDPTGVGDAFRRGC